MRAPTLQGWLDSLEDPLEQFRRQENTRDIMTFSDESFPDEHTHWIEEQRAWRESCILADQSYHMDDLLVEGPGAIDLFETIGVNSFRSFKSGSPPQAKQLVACNPDGYVIGDSVLFYLDEHRFRSVGIEPIQNWIEFHAETGDYEVDAQRSYSPHGGTPPENFRFEIQGPDAIQVMESVVDEPLPSVSFFEMDQIMIDGREIYCLGHGMAGAPGLEIFGPFRFGDAVKETILDAGEEYGIRQLGSKSYRSTVVESGWISRPVPAVYVTEELADYRRWLDADGFEGNLALSGNYVSDEMSDYYFTPFDLGYTHLVDFDHDFIGREALEQRAEEPGRTKVTLVWNDEDVIDIFASLFREGETSRFLDLPDPRNLAAKFQYDQVLKNGEGVGISISDKYTVNERSMLSLACIKSEWGEPGTEVRLVWGEENQERKNVERHELTEVRATVAPAPYSTAREDL